MILLSVAGFILSVISLFIPSKSFLFAPIFLSIFAIFLSIIGYRIEKINKNKNKEFISKIIIIITALIAIYITSEIIFAYL